MSDAFSTHNILDNKHVAKSSCDTLGIEANDDLDLLKSLAERVITRGS